MRRALQLAGKGFAPPNPMVGCVLVKAGQVVGEGYHLYTGMAHAEAAALTAAGPNARGSGAYVTLEPCSHHGKTPPCSDALIAAGVTRVVAACTDPSPKVSGSGFRRLEQHGIRVDLGLLEAEATELNRDFIFFHTHKLPYVTLKAASSLDGKIAAHSGDSKWITNEKSRQYVHKLRARSGAVMTGIGTLLADDALLTSRLQPAPPRQPLRIIVDSMLRTPLESAVVKSVSARQPVLIFCTDQAPCTAESALKSHDVEVIRLTGSNGKVDLVALINELAQRDVISVLLEAGGALNAAMLKAGLVHRALFFYAPIIIGGRDAHSSVEGIGADLVQNAIQLKRTKVMRFGEDIAIAAEFENAANALEKGPVRS